MDILSNLVRGKRVLLLGYGAEGRSTRKLLMEIGLHSSLDIADIDPPQDVSGCAAYSGPGYLEHINDYDIAFKSPGIVLPLEYRARDCVITSQTEAFLQEFGGQVIGVTGTKGKSTVSSLLYHTLSTNDIPCLLAGNIGVPVFDIVKDIKPETTVILELSCHQLEICGYSPATAVFLNIFEDHLDHYGSFEDYYNAKKNIYVHQRPHDTLYCDKSVQPAAGESVSRVIVPDMSALPFGSLEDVGGVKLRGRHNLGNCAFVYSIAKSFGITDDGFVASLRSYVPLPHRLEFIGNKNGVDYYDDSISTTAQSAISAVESVRNAATILLGGMDRGIDYSALVDYLSASKLVNVICMYKSGKRVFEMLAGRADRMESESREGNGGGEGSDGNGVSEDNGGCEGSGGGEGNSGGEGRMGAGPTIIYCEDLYEAVETAQKVTPRGTACILSPAAASYGDFKNFEERGNAYKRAIFGNTDEGNNQDCIG